MWMKITHKNFTSFTFVILTDREEVSLLEKSEFWKIISLEKRG